LSQGRKWQNSDQQEYGCFNHRALVCFVLFGFDGLGPVFDFEKVQTLFLCHCPEKANRIGFGFEIRLWFGNITSLRVASAVSTGGL
jgi:hypothetical protein